VTSSINKRRAVTNDDSTLSFNEKIIAEFRASEGHAATFGDAPLLLLTTKGAKSGKEHTNPVMYMPDEHDVSRVYIFASYAGADVNPDWYHNLVAYPNDVLVEIGTASIPADAVVLDEPLLSEIYAEQSRRYPGFAEYQEKTTRPIPVVALNLHR
jgi:deazaflavin-dependent oxidoreductase (nitroreductase family)